MKTHVKKKRFQAYCRKQVFDGLINQEDGQWKRADSNKAMDNDMRAGYRVGRR